MPNLDRSRESTGLRRGKKQKRGGTYHFGGGHADSLDIELSTAHAEQILKTWPQKVHDEHIVQIFLTKVVNSRDTGCFTA